MQWSLAQWRRRLISVSIPLLCAAAVLALLIAPIGMGESRWERTLNDAAHAPLFAVVALLALFWLRRVAHFKHSAAYVVAFSIAVLLGAAGEIAQALSGNRYAQWRDLFTDALGASIALGIHAAFDGKWALPLRIRLLSLAVAGAATSYAASPVLQVAQAYRVREQQLPQLLDWRHPSGYSFVSAAAAHATLATPPAPWNDGACKLAMHLRPGAAHDESLRYVGITIEEPWPDWSGYSAVRVELVNPSNTPALLTLRVDDRTHDNRHEDRLNWPMNLPAKTRQAFTVPLNTVRTAPEDRQMDIAHIAKIVLFQDAKRGATPVYVCAVDLVK